MDMIRENPQSHDRSWFWFWDHFGDVRAVASDRADAVSRVDTAIGEQAFGGCDEDAGGERIDRRADLVRRRE
jgi:hypothetical protein